jgi:CubicO group peptidase (beta-lactamase class C family)
MNEYTSPLLRFACLLLILALAACAAPAMPATPATVSSPTATLPPTPISSPLSSFAARSPASETHWPSPDWAVAEPQARGVDAGLLAGLPDAVARIAPRVTSLLVIRGGDIVFEQYWGDNDRSTAHEIYSCTKSFTSTLAGIAHDQDKIDRLDRKMLDYFPGCAYQNPGGGKADITVEDLLTMTSGLEWVEGDPAYRNLYTSKDWAQFMLDLPMAAAPGSKFNYCSGCSHLLMALVGAAVGMNPADYAEKYLLEPIGLEPRYWQRDNQSIPVGGWGLNITPRDMARLGFLFLHNGMWDGKRVVSEEWVKAATTAYKQGSPTMGYGYQWWVRPSAGGYAALGLDGQMIAVFPAKDLVVVMTASGEDHENEFKLIEQEILPAAQ